MLRAKWIRNAPDGNGTLFRGDMYQVPMAGALGGTTGHRIWEQNLVAQYAVGTRMVLEDGRVFRYAKATNTITDNKHGLKFWNQIGDGITYTAVLVAKSVGDKTVQVDSGKGSGGLAKDALVGGYLMLHTHAATKYQHFRGILGNTLADSNGYTIITVDMPWNVALTTSHGVEVCLNPYSSVQLRDGSSGHTGSATSSVAGFPYAVTSVANKYIWIQTWGPIWCNPHGTYCKGGTSDVRQVVFDREGSISEQSQTVAGDIHTEQIAGFIINRGAGPPLVMLQISP